MSAADKYAEWIVKNQDKKGTEEFEVVAEAYRQASSEQPIEQQAEPSGLASLAANPLMRGVMAMGMPVLGAAEWVSPAVAESNKELRRLIEEGKRGQSPTMQTVGDVADIGGSIASPFLLGPAKLMAPAKTFVGAAGQGALMGGLGGATTAIGDSDIEAKLRATGLGAAVGGVATPLIGGTLRGLGNIAAPAVFEKSAERGAAKLATKAAEGDAPIIARSFAATRQGPSGETGAQVAEPLGRLEMSALQKAWQERMPTEYQRNLLSQQEVRKDAIAALNAATEPTRSGALRAADEASRDMVRLPKVAEAMRGSSDKAIEMVKRMQLARDLAENRAQNLYPVNQMSSRGMSGQPRLAGRYSYASDLAQRAEQASAAAADQSLLAGRAARIVEEQIGSYAERGLKPLTADSLVEAINRVKSAEGNLTNDNLRLISNRLTRAVERARRPDGTISPEDVYTLRKTGINDTIKSVVGDDKALAKQLSGGELMGLRSQLDDAIEKAGGEGWSDYLKDYATRRTAIEGPLKRMESVDESASKAGPKISKLLNEEYNWTQLNLLNPVITAINAAMRGAEGVAGEKVNRAGARLMLPENLPRLGEMMLQYQAKPQGLLGDILRYQGGVVPASYGLLNTNTQE